MTRWFVDIYPCGACENGPMVGSKCRKGHNTRYAEGCQDCGTLVNSEWYFFKKKCPDFIYYRPHDPSGS